MSDDGNGGGYQTTLNYQELMALGGEWVTLGQGLLNIQSTLNLGNAYWAGADKYGVEFQKTWGPAAETADDALTQLGGGVVGQIAPGIEATGQLFGSADQVSGEQADGLRG